MIFIFFYLGRVVLLPWWNIFYLSGVEAQSFESWYSWFLPFLRRWFIIPTRIFFQIHYSRRLLITYWLNDFLSGILVSFCIVPSAFKLLLHPDSVSSFVWSRYGGYWRNKQTIRPDSTNYIGGPGTCPPGKFWKIGLSETPYPAFPGSNTTNLYVYFVKLFSESHYSWFPSRSAKIQDSQVFKRKIQDSYIFCKYDSWFMIPLPPPIPWYHFHDFNTVTEHFLSSIDIILLPWCNIFYLDIILLRSWCNIFYLDIIVLPWCNIFHLDIILLPWSNGSCCDI